MAERARACRLFPAGNDLRHRRMLVGKPVRRVEAVVDLRLRVLPGAPGHLFLYDILHECLHFPAPRQVMEIQSAVAGARSAAGSALPGRYDPASRSSKARLRSTPQ